MTLQEAIEVYLSAKGKNKGKAFKAAVDRAFRYLLETCGVKCLHEYTRADALMYGYYFVNKGLVGSSITGVFNTLRSVNKFASAELALNLKNPFVGLYYGRNAGVAKRKPISLAGIRLIQSECKRLDDNMRFTCKLTPKLHYISYIAFYWNLLAILT